MSNFAALTPYDNRYYNCNKIVANPIQAYPFAFNNDSFGSNWRFWYTHICFHANHRTTAVALMQMLHDQQVLDLSCFHLHYYDHFLTIIKYTIQNKSVMIIKNTSGLKCWHCRGTIPTSYYDAFFTEHTDATSFAWISDISQLKNVLNKKNSTCTLLLVVTKYVRPCC